MKAGINRKDMSRAVARLMSLHYRRTAMNIPDKTIKAHIIL